MRISRQPSSFIKGQFFSARMIDHEVNPGCLTGLLLADCLLMSICSFIYRLRLRFALKTIVPVSAVNSRQTRVMVKSLKWTVSTPRS